MSEEQEPLHFLDYWRVIRSRQEVVIAVFLLIVVTGVVVTYALPRFYSASCVIHVKEETPDVDVFGRNVMRFDPLFLRTQYEIIQSRPIIEEAVRKLQMDERLSRIYGYAHLDPEAVLDRTVRILSRAMRVEQYRETKLIAVSVTLSEPRETVHRDVAAVANMIATVYREESMRKSRESRERALQAMHDQLEEQRKKVALAETKVEEIRLKFRLDLMPTAPGTGFSLDAMALTRLEDQRIRAVGELAEKKARYDKIMSLPPDELLSAFPYIVGDPALQQLVTSKRTAEVELVELKKNAVGPKHPDYLRVDGVIAELTRTIDGALKGLRRGIEADYEAVQSKVTALDEMLEVRRAAERSAAAGGYRVFEKAQEELEHVRKLRDALEMRYLQERIELNIPASPVEVVESAKPADPERPVSPKLLLNVILSIVLGLVSGIGLAFFVEYLDTSLKTVEDVEKHMGIPVIGVIPQKVRHLIEETGQSGHAEAYRVLRANIQFSDRFRGGRTLCATSGSVGEGKSMTIFNLAYVCAQLGDRTLIVDADLHRPRQHKILRTSNAVGLANVLVGDTTVEQAIQHTKVAKLDFLPSGKMSSGVHGLLDTARLREFIERVKGMYDRVLFDAPPMIGVSDASLLVRELEGTLLVVQHRKYPRTVSKRARDMVENVGGRLVGVVLNNINVARDYYYYYHHYYGSYYHQQPGREKKA